jgi:hypothetical protein
MGYEDPSPCPGMMQLPGQIAVSSYMVILTQLMPETKITTEVKRVNE